MAGISHILEIYRKKGKDFMNNLFDRFVTINEKLDGSNFAIEKDPITKQLTYFKRNTDIPISLIDRTLARYYEKPIAYFNTMDESIKAKMPLGWKFGFEYFVSEQPQEIMYDRVPKNNLVLSYIHVKNNTGKIVRTIQEKVELDKWADFLCVERSPIIFQGVLNDDQKIAIMDFIDTPNDQLTEKFKTDSFTKFVVAILNPKMKKTLLNEDLEKSIEGLVFRFGSEENDIVLAKLVDPIFSELAKQKISEKVEGEGNDLYHYTLIDIMNFVDSINLKKIKPKGRTYEERYLNFICDLFNQFIHEKGADYEDVDFNEPAYLKKPEFDLNSDFIHNDETMRLIDANGSYKKLFKIMLASLKKKKKKTNGILTKEIVRQFNLTIDKINSHLMQNLKENEIPLFSEFLNIRGRQPDIEEDEEPLQQEEPVAPTEDWNQFKDTMGLISQDAEPEAKQKKTKGKKVNIIVGRFQPFHNGHLQMIKDLYMANKLPVVIIAIHPGHNKSGNSPFSMSTMRTMMTAIMQEGNGSICDFRIVGRGFIGDILDALRPKYEPILWGVGPDRINDYQKQIELNYKRNNELNLNDKFELMETKRSLSGTDVREFIVGDKFGEFKAKVPKSVQALYPLFRTDIAKAEHEKTKQD